MNGLDKWPWPWQSPRGCMVLVKYSKSKSKAGAWHLFDWPCCDCARTVLSPSAKVWHLCKSIRTAKPDTAEQCSGSDHSICLKKYDIPPPPGLSVKVAAQPCVCHRVWEKTANDPPSMPLVSQQPLGGATSWLPLVGLCQWRGCSKWSLWEHHGCESHWWLTYIGNWGNSSQVEQPFQWFSTLLVKCQPFVLGLILQTSTLPSWVWADHLQVPLLHISSQLNLHLSSSNPIKFCPFICVLLASVISSSCPIIVSSPEVYYSP